MMLDTNIVIDLREEDPRWFDWVSRVLVRSNDAVSVSAVVVGELAIKDGTYQNIVDMLAGIGIRVDPLDARATYAAGLAQRLYRAAGGTRDMLLGDFLIGGHALTANTPLMTRDPKPYRRYFPELTLITPETDHG